MGPTSRWVVDPQEGPAPGCRASPHVPHRRGAHPSTRSAPQQTSPENWSEAVKRLKAAPAAAPWSTPSGGGPLLMQRGPGSSAASSSRSACKWQTHTHKKGRGRS